MKRADLCIGDMRHPVAVQFATRPDDGAGGFLNQTWTTKATIFCRIEQKSGREAVNRDQIEATAHVEFWTHYRPDVLVTDRLLFEGRAHNIREVDDYFRDKSWLRIRADLGVLD